MSKVDRSHRSLTSKSNPRRVQKVNSDCTDSPKAALQDEGPFPWDEQARPSGSEQAQNADFVVEVNSLNMPLVLFLYACWVYSHQLISLWLWTLFLGCRMRGLWRPWSQSCPAWSSPILCIQGTLLCLRPRALQKQWAITGKSCWADRSFRCLLERFHPSSIFKF